MKRILFVLAALAVSTPAFAGNTQVSSSGFAKMGATGPWYGRSDGLYSDVQSRGVQVINNGTPGKQIGKSFYEDFTKWGGAAFGLKSGTWAAWANASTTAGTANQLLLGDGLVLNQIPIASNSAASTMTASGLEIFGGATSTYGLETTGGVLGANGGPFVVGVDPDFKICAQIYQTTAAGLTYLFVGFRDAEQYNSTYTSYTDYAAVGMKGAGPTDYTSVSVASANTETNGTDTITDGSTHTYCTLISAAGVASFTVDGSAPTVTQTPTMTKGMLVVPFIRSVQSATTTAHVYLKNLTVAYQ